MRFFGGNQRVADSADANSRAQKTAKVAFESDNSPKGNNSLTSNRRCSRTSSEVGGLMRVSAVENGVDIDFTESLIDTRRHRASNLRRFQKNAWTANTKTTLSSDEAHHHKIHKREAAFFHHLQLENQRERRELLAFTHSFLPNMMVEALETGFWSGLRSDNPALRQASGTIVVIELVGLFSLTTYLLQRSHGEMHLSKFLDRFFTLLIAIVVSYRGDIVQFTGGSLAIFFEAANDHEYFRHVCGSTLCSHSPPELSCLRATACCLEVHKQFRSFDIGVVDTCVPSVSVAIGISTGAVSLIGLSSGSAADGKNNFLYTVGGLPLRRANEAARIAEAVDDPATVLCPDAWELVASIVVEGPSLKHPEFHRLEALDVRKHTYPMVRHAAQLSFMPRMNSIKDIDADAVDMRLGTSMNFLHRSVKLAVVTGSSHVNDESRKVSVALLSVTGFDATTDEGLDVLAKLAVRLQEASNTQEGYFWKLTVDDSGIVFHFVWGLPPLVHLDDPQRACKACHTMVHVVTEMNLTCKVGIVTARFFCGAIGSVTRREYSMIGSAMQVCGNMMASAGPNLVLVDSATHQSCCGDLDFVTVDPVTVDPVVGGPCLEPTTVFQLLPPRSGDYVIDLTRSSAASPKRVSQAERPSPAIKLPRNSPVVFSPPCTPPWLAKPGRHRLSLTGDEPLFPTLWTSIWCERPAGGTSPRPPQIKDMLEPPSTKRLSIDTTDCETWKSQVPVPLPWPARSMACGGVSPVPAFSTWNSLKEVDGRVAQIHEDGGGLLLLVGPFGSGKTELAEHAICSATRNKKMLPIFGAMEMRSDHEWAAVRGVLRGALALLEPSGQIKSEEAFRTLLAKEAATSQELHALEHTKILLNAAGLDVNSRSPSHWGERSPLPSVQWEPSPRQNSPSPSRGSSKNLVPVENHEVFANCRHSRSDSIASIYTTNSHRSFDRRSSSHGSSTGKAMLLIGIVKRLVQKVLQTAPVVLALRVSQGTAIAPIDLSIFWQLVHSLEAMAMSRSPGSHELLIVVVCQSVHLEASIETGCYPKATPIFVGSLSPAEVTTYIHLCLGLKEVSNSSEEPAVPLEFALWLSRFADVPRYIEEGLTQLHRSEIIEIIEGKCIVKSSLESIRVADWIHTDMVARVIAYAEALSPEKQQVLQVATTLVGPFTTLDLAAANRLSAHRGLPQALIMQQCVRKISACMELTKSGFLRQVDADWDPHDAMQATTSEKTNLSGFSGARASSQNAPSWYIPSALIYQVIAATLFQSHRMELRRAILVTRALRNEHDRKKVLMSGRTSLNTDNAPKKNQLKRRAHDGEAKRHHLYQRQDDRDIPISCLVTPLLEHDDDESSGTMLDSYSDTPLHESGRTSNKLSIAYSHGPSLVRPLLVAPRQVELVEFLPLKCLARFSQARICYSLWIVAFGRELTLMVEGPQDVLDVFLLVAAIFLIWDLLFLVFNVRSYFRNLYIVSDLIIIVVIFSDISWALGMDDEEFLVFRRQSGTMIRIVSFFGKFAACICRLSAEIQIAATWLYNHPLCRRMANGFARPLKKLKADRSKIQSFAEEDAVSRRREQPTAQLAGIANKVANAVLLTLTVFTVLTTGTLWLVDYSYYPDEDLSMKAWTTLVNNANVAGDSTLLQDEIKLFDDFYNDLSYGPFSLCSGFMAPPMEDAHSVEDRCSNVMWRTSGDQFSQPSLAGFQVDVQSGNLTATFDFSSPARYEATTRFLLLLSLFILTFGLAVSINIVVTSMVTAPLMRILCTVRMISQKLKEHLPGLEDLEDDEDEVSILEQVVGKLATFVTKFNPDEGNQKGNEWINGRREDDRRPQSLVEPNTLVSNWRRRSNQNMENDGELLAKMDVSLDEVNSWSFNVLQLERFQLEGVTAWLLLRKVDCTEFDLHTEPVANYVRLISGRYLENPYHSWKHAVDVHHTLHRACDHLKVQYFLTPLDLFALAVAAIAHDVAHPGYNNIFLEQTSHELALRYNDKSPLENMHCATMFALMQSNPEARIFQGLSTKRYKEARNICVEVILHTDNAKHFDMVKELELFHATNSDLFDRREELDLLKKEQSRSLVLNAIMHGSDISNACKPWKICMSWADLVLSEFFLQGDEEKRLGIPVMFDRSKTNKPTSQVFFIEIFVLPFYKSMVKTFAPLWQLTDCLQANLQIWHLHRNAEVEMEEDKRHEANRKIAAHSEELRQLTDYAQSRSDSVVSKNDQLLREATKTLRAKTDPFGKLTLEPDVDLQPEVVTTRENGKQLDMGRRRSSERKGAHGRPGSSQQARRHSHNSQEVTRQPLVSEETLLLPGPTPSFSSEAHLQLHHAPLEAGVGFGSPTVSEITSLKPGSPPPEQPA